MDSSEIPKNEIPEFYTGAPVDSADLLFRDPFIDELWERIRHQHVLLAAPRRTGKTSIMDHLKSHPRDGYTVVYENVQDLGHPADFFISLLARFHEEHPKFLRDKLAAGWKFLTKAFSKVEEVGFSEFKVALRESDPDWRENWRKHGEKFFKQIRKHGEPVLIIVDELPDMLIQLKEHDAKLKPKDDEDKTLLKPFLAWFRTQRQTPPPADDPIRWLIGGSINLSSTLDSLKMGDLINDLDEIPLPIFSTGEVEHFVSLMLSKREVAFEEPVPSRVAAHLGRPIPIFLQMVTKDLHRLWRARLADPKTPTPPPPLDAQDVEGVFRKLVTSTAARNKLKHYYTRLDHYYEESVLSAAYELLNELSMSSDGLKRTTLYQTFERILQQEGLKLPKHKRKQKFDNLLSDLENDFYVVEVDEDLYDFASGLLKTWWRKYYA